jgi:hypothetical protein
LVYKHYGKEVIGAITGGQLSAETVDVLYSRVYTNFIEHVDGIDNGVSVADGVLRYKVGARCSSARFPCPSPPPGIRQKWVRLPRPFPWFTPTTLLR